MRMVDRLGGPTPDGAGWVALHGIQLGGIGVSVAVEPGRVVLVQGRSAGQIVAVLAASGIGLGVATFAASVGLWPLVAVFGVLGVLPLLAFGHSHRIEFRRGYVRIRRRNLFVRPSDERWRWDGGWHVRQIATSDRFERWQLLIRVNEGWIVAAVAAVDEEPVRELARRLDDVSA